MSVRKVSAEQTWSIRHEILRPGLPLSNCQFDEDKLASAVHFSFYESGLQTGVVSAYIVDFPADDKLSGCWQLRAMATIEEVRGKGHGVALVKALESYLVTCYGQWIWCNARENAVGFYQKLGFEEIGEGFEVVGVGPHRLMLKQLLSVDAKK